MNAHYRLKLPLTLLLILTLAGCGSSGRKAFKLGTDAETARDYETAMMQYKAALDKDPGMTEYRLRYERTRLAAALDHFQKGRRALDAGQMQVAHAEFARTVEIDPTNTLAQAELIKVDQILSNRSRNLPEPEHDIVALKNSLRTDSSPGALLTPKFTGPVSIRMSQQVRAIYETIGQLAGLNVIFDRDFPVTGPVRAIDLTDVDIYQALDIFSTLSGNFWQPVNPNTIIIVQDTQIKRRDYEEQILKIIYLTNPATSTELNDILTAIRTLMQLSYIVAYAPQNAIVIRDTASRVALAEKVIDGIDKSKPEIIVDVIVMEVDLQDLRQLGIIPPQSTSISLNPPNGGTTSTVSIADLNNLNASNFLVNIPSAAANFLATSSNTKLFQNPSVRVTDGKQVSLLVGSQVPVATSVQQGNGLNSLGPTVNVQFLNVGVSVDLTPRVLLNREVSLTATVKVSAIAGEREINTVSYPVISTRSITHDIRLAEGETNVLGGIISNSESVSMSGIPGINKIPLLKSLFGSNKTEKNQSEVIIMMTPHIIRMPDITEENMRAIFTGGQQTPRLRPAQVPTVGDQQPGRGAAPAATPAPAGNSPAAPTPGGGPTTSVTPPPLPPGVTIGAARPPAAIVLPEPRPTNTTIAGSATPVALAAGNPTPLNFTINGADIFAADLTVSFDPSALSIEEVREAGFLSRDGQAIATVRSIDTDKGIARISLERPAGTAAVSGTGALFTLMVKPGSRKGPSVLRITDFRVRDARQNVGVGKPSEVQVTVQ